MLLPSVLSTAALAWTANAFLLPPELANTFDKTSEASSKALAHGNGKAKTINLDCSSCPYALKSERHGRHEWTQDVNSDLELKFTAEHETLKLNGVPFYPVSAPFVPVLLSAKQLKKSDNDEVTTNKFEGYNGDLRLSYSLEFQNGQNLPTGGKDAKVFEILMTIMGLDDQMVNVDDVKITVLALPSGRPNSKHELLIMSVQSQLPKFDAQAAKCTTIFCRFAAKFSAAIQSAKSSAKTAANKVKCFCAKCIHVLGRPFHRGGRPRPHHVGSHRRPGTANTNNQGTRLPTHNRVKPGQFMRPHHHHIARPHKWIHAIAVGARHVLSYVVLPIIVGVFFGLAASAIGMLVGHLVVLVWLKLRRGGSSAEVAYQRLETNEKEHLPKYEDLEDTTEAVPQEKV